MWLTRARPAGFGIAVVLATAAGCTPAPTPEPTPSPEILEIALRPERERQTIRGFGASDAWSIQYVGRDWPVAKRERIADLLFSLDRGPDGSPEGIGLSAWRFNIGAGSAEQGPSSGIRDEWRRAPSFLGPEGDFDPSAQAGQRWFLRAAKARGVEEFTGFVNSPPVALTRNGKAFSSDGRSANLAADRYDDFADFLARVVRHLERADGVYLDNISPVNEPQWDWTGGQEGSPWLNAEIRRFVEEMSRSFREAGLTTRIEVTEAGRLNYLYQVADRPERGDQIAAFFDPTSPFYVGDLPNVSRKIAGHSYFTTHPTDSLVHTRKRLRSRLREIDPRLEFWMTEYCVLEDNEEIRGRGRDLGMHTALYVARVIHADLTVADASAWHWWLAVSPYDYKDGLVHIDRDTQEIHESKTLWALGHFSRFVRPGMRRIELERSDGRVDIAAGLLASAYRDPTTSRTVVVLINQLDAEALVRIRDGGARRYRVYRTTDAPHDNIRAAGMYVESAPLRLPPRSLVTLASVTATSSTPMGS